MHRLRGHRVHRSSVTTLHLTYKHRDRRCIVIVIIIIINNSIPNTRFVVCVFAAQLNEIGHLRGLNIANRDNTMEALLEERIQLLQERMKAITAQREQIEQANRGLEEELNKYITLMSIVTTYTILYFK